MKAIWKYPIDIESEQHIRVQADFTPLHVGIDPTGTPCVWGLVDPGNPEATVSFRVLIFGTGHPITGPEEGNFDDEPKYLGSFVQGPFVWHVFV